MLPNVWQMQQVLNRATSRLNALNDSIQTYKDLRTNIQDAKTRHQNVLTYFDNSYNKTKGPASIAFVKQVGTFEGEIADALTVRVKSGWTDIKSTLDRAKAINTEIDIQIATIDTKISDLEAIARTQSAQIESLREDIRQANRRTR